ncbi:plastocyanin/azurin family copper-binding protein [Gorillibacterium sp. sgz5001074]|uniref:plastocyanin/azurin family copper-binding protein n=1 Tax=Gorillibacterium sp. sgz5001074 TaxID=3446695 RepID=UPI003F66F575
MSRWTYFILFMAAGIFGFVALFMTVSENADKNAGETSSGPSLKLVASNFKFDQPEYTVKAGEKMKVSLSIKEGIHAVKISGNGVDIDLDKQNASKEVTFDKPGTYTIQCTLPCGAGHADMVSKLIVQ